MKKNDKVLIFVYGTLRKADSRSNLLSGATFICYDSIRGKLFSANWAYPYISFSQSNKDRVVGEVYETTYSHVIGTLDHFEGYHLRYDHTNDLFLRKKATTKSGKRVWVYIGGKHFQNGHYERIVSGDWCKARKERTDLQVQNKTV